MRKIHIKLIDKDWILEKCAYEIASRAYYIDYSINDDPKSSLTYYINYHAYTGKRFGIQVGYFTHIEKDEEYIKKFFKTARAMDYCICHSHKYAKILIDHGIKNVEVISPGVDLKTFYPKVHIGVIGRTYASGRKGESLIEQVYDTPGIEWHFTGKGWPGPSRFIPDSQLNDFYNQLDYVLVPSLYEGGPMCVVEGLACGIPIISSDVGWAWEFPHIPFENGNAESLRNVLEGLVAERMKLRSTVESVTWDNWAQKHIELFNTLVPESQSDEVMELPSVDLIIHGDESTSKGGPSGRIGQTRHGLSALGVRASLMSEHENNISDAKIAHVFNVWPAQTCLQTLRQAKNAGKLTVLSSIFLNLSDYKLFREEVPALFQKLRNDENQLDRELKNIASHLDDFNNMPVNEPYAGYHDQVKKCADLADHIIVLSEYEKNCLRHLHIDTQKISLVHNPVDARAVIGGDPELFHQKYNLKNFVLCVGRIETRKNQLMLAYAAKRFNVPVVFLGHEGDEKYAALVREVAGNNALFIPRIEHDSPMFASIYAAASAFCLPSWAEGASLSALEAGAAGLPLVLSDRDSAREYFGRYAAYVNPADVEAMGIAIRHAVQKKQDKQYTSDLQHFVLNNYSEENYARETLKCYNKTILMNKSYHKENTKLNKTIRKIYFDVTTLMHHVENPTGIARVEKNMINELIKDYKDNVIPVCWNSSSGSYCVLTHEQFYSCKFIYDVDKLELEGKINLLIEEDINENDILYIGGGAWIKNNNYVRSIKNIHNIKQCRTALLIHDIVKISMNYMYYSEKDAYIFRENLKNMISIADEFLIYSKTTLKNFVNFLQSNSIFYKKVSHFNLGNVIDTPRTDTPVEYLINRDYILFVSTIDPRKNHEMLINVWRRMIQNKKRNVPLLVFAGRETNFSDKIKYIINNDADIKNYCIIINNADDSEISCLYKNCLFTCYPSIFEGYGLPVAESLQYGKFCITSSRSSTAEIAPELTECIDPYDFKQWYDVINFYINNINILKEREKKIINGYIPTTYADSAKSLIQALSDVKISSSSETNFFDIDESIVFSNKIKTKNILYRGWYPCEINGMWQSRPYSYIAFYVSSNVTYLDISMYTCTPENVCISINGKNKKVYYIESYKTLELQIPKCKKEYQLIVIDFMSELHSPNDLGINEDERTIGIGVSSIYCKNNISNICHSIGNNDKFNEKNENITIKKYRNNHHKNIIFTYLDYYRCKILFEISHGSKRKHYKEKKYFLNSILINKILYFSHLSIFTRIKASYESYFYYRWCRFHWSCSFKETP